MKSTKVTDPAILAQLNGPKKVTDPALLEQLNAEEEEEIPYMPPPERKGLSGVWEDVKDIPGKVLEYGMNVPGKAAESWEQIFTHPVRAFKNLVAGAGETVEAPINLLGAVGPYLKERGITNKIPGFQVPDVGIEKAMGLEQEQPGDELIRQMFMFAGLPKVIPAIPGTKNISKRIKNINEHGLLTKKSENLAERHETVNAEHKAATEDFNALKNFLESQPGFETSNLYALQRKAVEAEQKLGALREQTETIPEYLRATEEPNAAEKTPLSLVESVYPPEKGIVSEEPIRKAENLLKEHEQKTEEIEKQFGEGHLRKGYTHDVPIAEGVTKKISENKKQIGKIYDAIEQDLEDKHILIPRTDQLAQAEKAARKLLEDSRGFFKNDADFEKAVKKIIEGDEGVKKGPSDIVSASDVLKNYRTMRHLSQKLHKEAYSTKVAGNKELQSEILGRAEEFENTAQNLETLLENNDLGSPLKNLKIANKRWREEIIPLYKNKTYKQFLNGLGPDNIMKSLRGHGPGQAIIRKIIKEDPELLRNVIGQRYANNPEKLHEFDELTQEYTQHMPEVQEFKKHHFESKESQAKAKIALERAKHEHQMQREQADIAHRKATEKASQETRAKKAETHKENQLKQKEHQEKLKHFKLHNEIKELENKSLKLKDHADKLQATASRRDISLKKKLDLEEEIKQTKEKLTKVDKDRALARKLLKGAGYVGAAALGVPLYSIGKKLFGNGGS